MYIIIGFIGVIINLVIMFSIINGKYTPHTLSGATGLQGLRGEYGISGSQGARGVTGDKGGRGGTAQSGRKGSIGAHGKIIFCSTDDCIKANSEYHSIDQEQSVRLWPSHDCINAGDPVSHGPWDNINDKNNHDIKCGYNWVWSDRKADDSCVKAGENVKFLSDKTDDTKKVSWVNHDGISSSISPTLSNLKGGFGVSSNKDNCIDSCPECPGQQLWSNTQNRYVNSRAVSCGREINDRSRPPIVDGTCKNSTFNELEGKVKTFLNPTNSMSIRYSNPTYHHLIY